MANGLAEQPMFSVVLAESVNAPRRDPGWVGKSIVGGVLSAAPMLLSQAHLLWAWLPEDWSGGHRLAVLGVLGVAGILFGWVVLGYLYRIFVDALNGAEPALLPHWQDWRHFLYAGVCLSLIMLGYLIVAAVGLTGIISASGLVPVGEDPARASALMLLLVTTVFVLYSFYPIAFARFAAEGRVWAAFDPFALWGDVRRALARGYLQACVAFIGLWLLGSIVLGLLPYVGVVLVSIYLFYMMVVFARVFGSYIREEPRKPEGWPGSEN